MKHLVSHWPRLRILIIYSAYFRFTTSLREVSYPCLSMPEYHADTTNSYSYIYQRVVLVSSKMHGCLRDCISCVAQYFISGSCEFDDILFVGNWLFCFYPYVYITYYVLTFMIGSITFVT